MGFKGSVESFSLADVFQNLAMNQQTGTLHVVAPDGAEKLVYFNAGQVRNISRGKGKALVTPLAFVGRGACDETQIETAKERQRETNQPIAACLLELGIISKDQFKDVTRAQMEEEIFDLFQWEKANFEFNEGNPPEGTFVDQIPDGPTLPISHLIMEAARRVDEWERLSKSISNYKEIFSMDLAARKAIEKGEMEMEVTERRVAMLVDGARDVDDLIEDSGLFEFEVLTALAGFLQSCLIRQATAKELAFAEEECARNSLHKRRIKVLERLLAVAGENARTRRELAEILAKEGQTEKACIHFTVLAEMETAVGKKDNALELYRRILTIAPKHVKAHEQLGADYAKRNLKREAFVHYREVFDALREQKRLREARTAGMAALDCEPSHTELRNALIEVLLADGQKDAAAEQLELMGDHAARVGNMKLAADSYRRAMQYRPGNKDLKHKLGDVILSKEDRRAMKRRMFNMVVGAAIVAVIAGAFAFLEFSNKRKLNLAQRSADALLIAAADFEKEEKFVDARNSYEQAMAAYRAVTNVFSPVLKIGQEARNRINDIGGRIAAADLRAEEVKDKGLKRARADLLAAEQALKQGNIFEARDLFDKVLKNVYADEEALKLATPALDDTQKKIDKFDDVVKRLKKNPNQAFASVEEEASFKKTILRDFKSNLIGSRLDMAQMELPLLIMPNNSNITVSLNGKLVGSVSIGQPREANTFRYPHTGNNKFEFKKPGYKTVELTPADLQGPTYYLKMDREPSIKLELRPSAPGITLSGEPALDGDSIYVGTNNGALLEIVEKDKPIARRYDLPGGGGIYKEVYGPIFVYKNAKGARQIVYCTKAGDIVGLTETPTGFKEVWTPFKATETPLSAPPSFSPVGYVTGPVAMLPAEKKLVLVNCETGTPVSPNDTALHFKATISAPVTVIRNNNVLVAGCIDGNLYGVTLGTVKSDQWTTTAKAAAIRGKPFLADGRLIAGADDGKFYFFDPNKGGYKDGEVALEGSIVSQPVVLNKKFYVGTVLTERFWCVDTATRKFLWQKDDRDLGPVSHSPLLLNNSVYFGTDTGRLFALDAEKGAIRWSYQVESKGAIVGPPLSKGKRVYAISADGEIIGFDEVEN